MNVFVDTNVLLDVLGRRAPFLASAARLWTLVETGACKGHVSAMSFNNAYYILRKQIGRPKALESIRLIREVFSVVPVDQRILDRALAADNMQDFEDAIQYFSALRVRAKYLITRNQGHFPTGGPVVASAQEYLKRISAKAKGKKEK